MLIQMLMCLLILMNFVDASSDALVDADSEADVLADSDALDDTDSEADVLLTQIHLLMLIQKLMCLLTQMLVLC